MTGNGKPTGEWLIDFLRHNAFNIVMAGFLAYAWFTSNNSAIAGQLSEVNAKVDLALEKADVNAKSLRTRERFMNDTTNQVNFLCYRISECRALYQPIAVPQ